MLAIAMLISAVATLVRAETHVVFFNNLCTFGTPKIIASVSEQLQQLNDGSGWSNNGGPLDGFAYLDSDEFPCGPWGDDCAHVRFILDNSQPGSSAVISLIPPNQFYGEVEYEWASPFIDETGCKGQLDTTGCFTDDCPTALHSPSDDASLITSTCNEGDINLRITFCPSGPTR